MQWYNILALNGAGFLAGFINTLAGGGSMLTLPLLIFLGLPANVANGTNRVAILFQSMAGLRAFKVKNAIDFKVDSRLAIPAVIGAIPGAILASYLNADAMKKIIAITLISMFLLIVFKPKVWEKSMTSDPAKPLWWHYPLFVMIGFYGGFIQVGIGFILLAGLVMGSGYDLVRGNAVKKLIILLYTPVALAIFFYNGQVDIKAGLFLAVGNALGAVAAANFAVSWGPKAVKYFLLVALVVVSLKLLEVF